MSSTTTSSSSGNRIPRLCPDACPEVGALAAMARYDKNRSVWRPGFYTPRRSRRPRTPRDHHRRRRSRWTARSTDPPGDPLVAVGSATHARRGLVPWWGVRPRNPTRALDEWAELLSRHGYLSVAIAHTPRTDLERIVLTMNLGGTLPQCREFKYLNYDRPLDFTRVVEALAERCRPALVGFDRSVGAGLPGAFIGIRFGDDGRRCGTGVHARARPGLRRTRGRRRSSHSHRKVPATMVSAPIPGTPFIVPS